MNIKFMYEALSYAQMAAQLNEVPVGAVITKDDLIVGAGYNRRETGKNALYHAEIEAINSACKNLGGWRLWQCEMYVTLEPCIMCAGAIVNARIPRLYFGAYDEKNGACGSAVNLLNLPYQFKPQYVGGILEEESRKIIDDFFKSLRKS